MKIQIRGRDLVLYVVGREPTTEGDMFEATTEPQRERSCNYGTTSDGANYFSCTRGAPAFRVLRYRYDPALHEVLREAEGGGA